MITLDGKPLLIEDEGADLHAWMRRYQDLTDLRIAGRLPVALESHRSSSRNGQKSGPGLPIPNYSAERPLKLNTLYWPTGAARWGYGLFLADEKTALSFDASNRLELVMGDSEHSVKTARMWLLPPHPVSACPDGTDEERLWILPLVDDRYWWQYYDLGAFELDGGTTWEDLYQWLGVMIGSVITVDAVDQRYLHPDPIELRRNYDNAAMLLDAIAHSIGHRILYRGPGQVFSRSRTQALADIANLPADYQLQAGGNFKPSVHVPQNVIVSFPKWSWGVPWCGGDLWRVTIPATIDAREDGTTKIIHSTAYADWTDVGQGGSPNNQSDLTPLAQAIAEDFYGWHSTSFDLTYIGMQPLVSTGFDDCIEWYFGQQLNDASYRAHTRVSSHPHNFGVEQNLSQNFNWTVLDHFQIGKLDEDLVPQSQQGDGYAQVSIWDTTAGAEVDTYFDVRAYDWLEVAMQAGMRVELHWHCEENAWYFLPPPGMGATIVGTMKTDRTRELIGGLSIGYADVLITSKVGSAGEPVGETVKVVFADERWFGAVGNQQAGCKVVADWIFDPVKAAELQQAKPWFWIVKESQELASGFWGRTLEDRSGDGQQDVKCEVLRLVSHGNCDFDPRLWKPSAPSVQCGVLVIEWIPDAQELSGGSWEIVDSSTWNRCCLPELTPPPPSDPTKTGIRVPLNGTPTRQCNPEPADTDLTVRYEAGTFTRMVTGAIFFCEFHNAIENLTSNSTMYYSVVESQQLPLQIRGALTQNACQTDFLVARNNFTEASPYPFNQKIPQSMLPLTIFNYHAGLKFDLFTADWDDDLRQYKLIEVIPHRRKFVTNLRLGVETLDEQGVGTGCFRDLYDEQEGYIEICRLADEDKVLAEYRLETVARPFDFRLTKNQTGSGEQANCTASLDFEYYPETVRVSCPLPGKITKSIALKDEWFVIDVADDLTCIYQTKQRRIYFDDCGAEVESNVICSTDEQCDTGSGSG